MLAEIWIISREGDSKNRGHEIHEKYRDAIEVPLMLLQTTLFLREQEIPIADAPLSVQLMSKGCEPHWR